MRYRADIDGLRAIAVLPVILFHAGTGGFDGGFVGVDVFFVVSGFLITSIIAGEIGAGTFTIARFYERRVRRILPALFLVVAASVPLALVILVPEHLEDFGQSVIATALFGSNFFFYLEDGYFEGPAELHPLLHTWSLAVEEQFYVLFPLLMLALGRRRIGYTAPLTLLALASFAFAAWQLGADASAAFYLLPARFWELMLGALLAVSMTAAPPTRLLAAALTGSGLVMIGAAVALFDGGTPFPGPAALLPCLGAALVIIGGRRENPVSGLLGAEPIRGVGLISYSLYLWHFPLIVFARHLIVRPFTGLEIAVLVAVTFLLSFFAWRYVEQPFRTRPVRIPRKSLLPLAGYAVAVSIAFGLFTDFSDGAPWRLPVEAQSHLQAREDKDSSCLRRRENCDIGSEAEAPRYLLWGDSHAGAVLPAFRVLSAETGIPGRAALRGGCPPLLGYRLLHVIGDSCAAHIEATFAALTESDTPTVFLAARWTKSVEASMYGFEGGRHVPMIDTEAPGPDGSESDLPNPVLARALSRTLAALRQAGKSVVILGPIPEIGWHVPHTLAQRERFGSLLGALAINPSLEAFQARNARTVALLARMSAAHGARLVLLHQALCADEGGCRIRGDSGLFYHDTDHLTLTGARELVGILRPEFARMAAAPVGP